MTPMKGKKMRRRGGMSSDTPRIGKKTSVVWNFFRALPHDNGISRAVCVLCKVVFKNPGGSTTGMRGHLDRKHAGAIENLHRRNRAAELAASRTANATATTTSATASLEDILLETSTPPSTPRVGEVGETEIFEGDNECLIELEDEVIVNQEQSVADSRRSTGMHTLPGPPPEVYTMTEAHETAKCMALYLITNLLPVHTLENPFFRKMLLNLNELFFLRVCGKNGNILPFVVATIDEMYVDVKEEIQREVQGKHLSLSLDLHQKSATELYLLATISYIREDWHFQSRLLGVRMLPDYSPGMDGSILSEKISTVVQSLLDEYNVKNDQIMSVFINSSEPESQMQILNHSTTTCFVHALSRSYQVLYTQVENVLKYDIKAECERLALTLCQNYRNLSNHPGKMAEALKCQLNSTPARGTLPSTQLEMDDLNALTKLQGPINDIVECIMEEPEFTASTIIPMILGLRRLFEEEVQDTACNGKEIMDAVQKFIEDTLLIDLNATEIGNKDLAVCTFLDPRYKKMTFFNEDQRQFVYDSVLELLYENGKKVSNSDTGTIMSVRSENPAYSGMNGASPANDPLNTNSSCTSPSLTKTGKSSSKMVAILTKVIQRKHVPAPSTECQEELSKYLREPIPIMEVDPCQWWSGNCDKYPNLSSLAKKYLCMNGFARSPRLTFTKAGTRLHSSFFQIEQEFLDKMLCLRAHISSTDVDGLDDFQETSKESQTPPDHLITVKSETIQLMDEGD